METVSEAAHFFRLLFMPSRFELDWKKYRKTAKKWNDDLATPQELRWLETLRSSMWTTFVNSNGKPEWSMLDKSMLEALDELNEQWQEDEGLEMFVNGDKSTKYWKDVEAILVKYVTEPHANASHDSVEGLVRDNILPKLRWYRNESRVKSFLRIPILTPKMLDALAANISARAQAYEEVSDFLICL